MSKNKQRKRYIHFGRSHAEGYVHPEGSNFTELRRFCGVYLSN